MKRQENIFPKNRRNSYQKREKPKKNRKITHLLEGIE